MPADDDSGLDRVHGCAVGGDDVDAEVECRQLALGTDVEAGIAEVASNGVGLVERLDRPAVRGCETRERERE